MLRLCHSLVQIVILINKKSHKGTKQTKKKLSALCAFVGKYNMKLKKDKAVLQNFKDATQYEWLETNGLGGWSSSSVIGVHTRRYHGLFVAATNPPAERTVMLSKLDETIVTADKRIELGCNLYNSDIISPNGHHCLESFTLIKFRNSVRVSAFLNSPTNADVVVTEFCFCTPRIIIHKCMASITTATP